MKRCPGCESERVLRSRTRNWWERVRRAVTRNRPYRCQACGWRGFMADEGPTSWELRLQFDPVGGSGLTPERDDDVEFDLTVLDSAVPPRREPVDPSHLDQPEKQR